MGDITIDQIKTLLEEQTKQIQEDITTNYKDLKQILNKNKEQISKLQNRCLYLERKLRKNNIVIFGLDVKDNIEKTVIQEINRLLGLKLEINNINNVYKVGKTRKPPIVVEFVSFLKKQEIFKNKEKLRALNGTNISISNDLCEEDRTESKLLRKHLKKAKDNNKQARIKGNKIQIDNVWYTTKDLENEDIEDTEYDTNESSSEDENKEDHSNENRQKGKLVREKPHKENSERKQEENYRDTGTLESRKKETHNTSPTTARKTRNKKRNI